MIVEKGEQAMKRAILVIAGIAAAVLFLSCTKSDDKVAIRVGELQITAKMIRDEYLAMSPAARPDLKTIDEKESFAKDIAAKETMLLEARSRGLDKLPEVAQARTTGISRRAWQAFYEEEIKSKVTVTDQDIQDLYAKQDYTYHLGWLFVRSKALAEQLAQRIRQGESFESLAALYSIDGSRAENGDIGNRTLGSLPVEIEQAVLAMSPGEVSQAIPFDSYCVILKLYEKSPSEKQTLEQAREGLRAVLRATGENARQREIAARLRKEFNLELNAAVVDLITAKTAAVNSTAGGPPGQIPEFSDEEMDRELVKWDGGAWTLRKYAENVRALRDYMRPGYGVDREVVQSLVSDYATGELWQAELKKKGFETRPEVLEAGERATEEVIVTLLHDDLVKDVKMDAARLAAFYEEHKAELMTEEGTRLAVIVSADEAGAKAVYDQLAAGADFEATAREKSIDATTGPKGGELMRPVYRQEIEQFPDLKQVLDGLAVGAYSVPVPVPPGFGPSGHMIVKVLERIEPRQLLLEEIQEDLGARALALEQDKVFGEWLTARMTEHNVEVFPDVLNGIDFAAIKDQEA